MRLPDCQTYQHWYSQLVNRPLLSVCFFHIEAGSEPLREWLKKLPAQDRKTIGEDIKTVQFG